MLITFDNRLIFSESGLVLYVAKDSGGYVHISNNDGRIAEFPSKLSEEQIINIIKENYHAGVKVTDLGAGLFEAELEG